MDPKSRTRDQMIQAARSGSQNLQEGSVDSATSQKLELKLTGTARSSPMELQRDYRKFLQHCGLPEWPPDHQALVRFRALSLLNLCVHLVVRRLYAQAAAFEREGGFTERLYRRRQAARQQHP